MNKILPKLSVALALLLLPLWLVAQSGSVDLVTYENTTITDNFTSNPNNPSVTVYPTHGDISWYGNVNDGWTIEYTPDEDYVGIDYFRMFVWGGGGSFGWRDYNVVVQQALVKAEPDYAYTSAGTPVTIPVLDNDFSSNGVFQLAAAPAVNHGTAQVQNNEIVFTPDQNFAGVAHFNYVLCNGFGTCDETFVNVSVMGVDPPEPDTVRVFTKRDQSQLVLVPDSYTLVDGPYSGIYDPAADIPTYTPDPFFVGDDYLLFSHDNTTTYYDIKVLDLPTNTFAFEDRIFTTAGSEVSFNVLDNDLFGTDAGCFSFSQPEFGTVALSSNPLDPDGSLVYTPPPGFIGVDQFTYSSNPPTCAGVQEQATVYVFVSNFEPNDIRFRMSTPKNTPIIIGYNIPTGVFSFSVEVQGTLGEAIFLPGQVDTVINGQQITGENLLIYIPNDGVDAGLDLFEIKYCLLDPQGGCAVDKSVKIDMDILDIGDGNTPLCVGDCVWAGDTNFDGVVNMEDLLPIGLHMGEIGQERPDATLSTWYGQFADDWSDLLLGNSSNSPNLKHIDADGDSIITATDTAAINLFYGRTHTMVPKELPFTTFQVYLEGDIFVDPGDLITLKVKVGSPSNPAADVYGFSFPFNYDPTFLIPESVHMDFYESSWLGYDSPVLHMTNNNLGGRLDVGFTRTNGISASGFGDIGEVKLVVVGDIPPARPDEPYFEVQLGGQAMTAMTASGQSVAVEVLPFTLKIRIPQEEETDTDEVVTDDQLKVFPNPAQDIVRVHLNGGHQFTDLVLTDMMGRPVQSWNNLSDNDARLNLGGLPNGMYLLQVTTPTTTLSRKVQVIR